MKKEKRLAVWLDHSNARLMEIIPGEAEVHRLPFDDTPGANIHHHEQGDKHFNNKNRDQLRAWYNKLGKVIGHYDHVLLFGPTDAKTELAHHLQEDRSFAHLKIEVKPADKMTVNQEEAFARDHFAAY